MSMVEEVATYLTGLGTCGSQNASPPSILLGKLTDEPDQVVALFAHGGTRPWRTMGGISGEQPTLLVTVRAVTYPVAWTLARVVFDALDGYRGTLSGTRYMAIMAARSIMDVGEDENGRELMTMAFHVKKDLS